MNYPTIQPLEASPRKPAAAIAVLCLVGLILTSGCSSVAYYHQAISGHLALISKRTPNEELINSSATDPQLVAQLQKVEALKLFAESQLGLPAKGQYSSYVDTGQRYIVWNVFAAPSLSLNAKQWCYPVIGCAAYRGYYDQQRAERHAEKLAAKGWDVYVGGTTAYSTLGWFEDPVLNTFVYRSDAQLADLLFHELAHQRLYINGDSQFNESFATLVASVGVQRWYAANNSENGFQEYRANRQKHQQFINLVSQFREKLSDLYSSQSLSETEKQTGKSQIIAELREAHNQLKDEWGGNSRYERWFSLPLNNAQLNTVSTYNQWVPALQNLLDQHDGDLESFYTATSELKNLSLTEREAYLAGLASSAR